MRFPALAIALTFLAGGAAHAQQSDSEPATYAVPLGNSPARGPVDAPVTIVEFSDFTCQFCGRVQDTLDQLDRLYPGKLRFVYRQMPLDIEEGTLPGEASLAAGAQGQFWPMHDRLFSSPGPFTRDVIETYARELGLDMARFRRDLDERVHLDEIERDFRDAAGLGFRSTPMFFINGRPVRGAQPLAVFAAVVEEELARADALVKDGVAPAELYEHLAARAEPPAAGPGDDLPEVPELDPATLYAIGLGLPGHGHGPDDAIVTIVKFTDFECGYCARVLPALQEVVRAYGDDVRIVFRHLPLRFHRRAPLAAEAAVEAAVQGRFFAYTPLLFGNQGALERADLEAYARVAGLDMARFRAALDDRRHLDAVAADTAAANALGVTGTPTMFVNGTPIVGAVPLGQLRGIIDVKLEQARSMVDAGGVARADVYTLIVSAADEDEHGDRSRLPRTTAAGELDMAQADYEMAVIAACRARDPDRARSLYDKLRKPGRRDDARSGCHTHGIDLAP